MFGASERRALQQVQTDTFNLMRRIDRIEKMLAELMRHDGMTPPIPEPDSDPSYG